MDATLFREPARRTFALKDGELSALDFGPRGRPVDIVFAHANGFNAQTYRQALLPLSGALRILALDLRGHGESRLPADPRRHVSWRPFADDLLAVLGALDAPVVLAGHSLGATTCVLAAARARGREVRSLVLFEPVLLSPWVYRLMRLPGAVGRAMRHQPLAVRAAGRRRRFADRSEAFAAYKGRGAFRTWPEATLADYVAGGLRPAAGGRVELACAPEWEARNYAAHRADPYRALRRTPAPVLILKAEHGSTCRLQPRRGLPPNTRVKIVPGASHFLPMERPDVVRSYLLDAAA